MLNPSLSLSWRRAFAGLALASVLSAWGCVGKRQRSLPGQLAQSGYFLADVATPRSDGGGGGSAKVSGSLGLTSSSASLALASPSPLASAPPRKIIRNGSLELLVNDVGQSIDKIASTAVAVGGYVEKSTQNNSGFRSASLTIRVPSARLDEAIADVKRLATVVERENVEGRDVTREYVDLDARLRNAQAEETQYLQILKRATTIKDTLDVTEKLSDVRGRIEEMQGEMRLLTTQIDMSSLEISLHAEADATVAGIHWRPLVQAKIAVNDMLSGLTDWVDSVVAFVICLPLIIVWLISIVVLFVITVRVIRFLGRKLGPKISWRLPWKRPSGSGSSAGQGAISTAS